MDPARGVFRTVEGSTYYPNDDFVVADALQVRKSASSDFCWKTARKSPARGPPRPRGLEWCLAQAPPLLPVSLTEDLRLLDAEVARSLELIAAMNDSQLVDLALTFSVARPTLNGVHDISLRGDGCEEVTEANVKEFARLRATADLGGQQTKSIGALVRGFRDVVPGAVYYCWSRPRNYEKR